MKRRHLKSLVVIGYFIAVAGVAMGSLKGNTLFSHTASSQSIGTFASYLTQNQTFFGGAGPLTLAGHLVQDKIFSGGDGMVALSLTMHADEEMASAQGEEQHVDMVIVLDQSGSMKGQKIQYAKQAVLHLLSALSAKDRVAIIGYANSVWKYSDLTSVTAANREELESIVYTISPGGNTNLGAGLQEGISTLLAASQNGNLGKVILISDGLANRGIIHPDALGNIASIAIEEEFAISTVGVGNDFNEQLMTTIADRGAGSYYYLVNPRSFAKVFHTEFEHTKTVAAHTVEIRIPLPNGASLLKASGYPITITNSHAIVHPGDLLAGQTRKLFLTLKLPTHSEKTYELRGINIRYIHKGSSYTTTLLETLRIACVHDPNEVFASIEQEEWEEKMLQEDFNTLRENIAIDLKNGNKDRALEQIDQYYHNNSKLNTRLGSAKVKNHLDEDLSNLRDVVRQTFQGSQQEIKEQQKANSKALQYRGYNERRSK